MLTLGVNVRAMPDEALLERHNEVIRSTEALAAEWDALTGLALLNRSPENGERANGLNISRRRPIYGSMAIALQDEVRHGPSRRLIVKHRRVVGFLFVALALAGCGDNLKPGGTPAGERSVVQTSVAGGMVARSENYRIVSTVTSGDLSATSAAHTVRGGAQ